MTPPQDALAALLAAADSVPGLRGYRGDARGKIQLPAVTVGAPVLEWQAFCEQPTAATFPLFLVTQLQDGAIERLLGWIGDLQAAVESATPATIQSATPTTFDLGNGPAAAYEMTVLYPLSG